MGVLFFSLLHFSFVFFSASSCMPHYCNLFKDVPPSTLGPRQNISINANVRQLNSRQVEGKSFFSLAESHPEGRTLKVKRDVWFR